MLNPRPYQHEAVTALYRYFQANSGNPVVVIPTGAGKSLVIAEFIRQAFSAYPNQRFVIVSHVAEILEQDASALREQWPAAPIGIFSASLDRREIAPITIASIQTAARSPGHFGRVDIVFVDECHLIGNKESTQYQAFLEHLRQRNPYLKVIGFTATPYRLGMGTILDNGIFTDICYDLSSPENFVALIRDGYLSMLIPRKTDEEIDTSGFRTRAGDFAKDDILAAMDKDDITEKVVKETIRNGTDRKSWIIFASGVEHAKHVAERFNHYGVRTAHVDATTPKAERAEILRAFKAGEYRAIANNSVLTTGFDNPSIDLIAVLRPTKSTGLWVQMLGRGCRVAEGKPNCLVLDFVGNTRRLGPINDPVLPRKKDGKGSGTAPVKVCPGCQTYVHASLRVCPHCGEEFPVQKKIFAVASTLDLIADRKEPDPVLDFDIQTLTFSFHKKMGKPPALKLTMICGLHMFHEYWCFEHGGYPARKAAERWLSCGAQLPIPATAAEANDRISELVQPKTLRVQMSRPYPTVINYGF